MQSISPYINFNGKCRDAMTFYRACLGGELELVDVAGSPAEASWTGEKDKIFHSTLTIQGRPLLMGSDMQDRAGYVKGNDVALAIGCDGEAEIHTLFQKLSEGGRVLQPLKTEFWGGVFGSLVDRYGLKWQLNWNKTEAGTASVN